MVTPAPRSITVLGATGSIGSSTVRVLRQHKEKFRVVALVASENVDALVQLALEFRPEIAVLANEQKAVALREALSPYGIETGAGKQAVLDAAMRPADLTVAAIAGTAGLAPTHAALKRGGTVALANKECLVCAGHAFMRDAQQFGAHILPLDSEHNALLQALGGEKLDAVERLTLTASGGPFRGRSRHELLHVTAQDALKHPTWTMGRKVTIDSATLMNKGLELIEAHHLFGVESRRLHVLVHPQSIVHGLVFWKDGAVTAGMASPDMCIPVAHCLGYPRRLEISTPPLDLVRLGSLSFEEVDAEAFPAVDLAFRAMNMQGGATVFNAANEIAVEAFLKDQISFLAISACVEDCMDYFTGYTDLKEPDSVDDAYALHDEAQIKAAEILMKFSNKHVVAN